MAPGTRTPLIQNKLAYLLQGLAPSLWEILDPPPPCCKTSTGKLLILKFCLFLFHCWHKKRRNKSREESDAARFAETLPETFDSEKQM